jgi:hypothetical protein
MQKPPKAQPVSVDLEKERLRQRLLRMIVRSEAQRRAPPQVKS